MTHHTQLNSSIKHCQFIELVSNKDLYPQSKGSGLSLLKVTTDLMEAHISLQGAQLLQFKPKNGAALLWLSPNCDFTPGVALRGGIPLCLPWFGPHPTDAKKPKHGFVRNREWQLIHASEISDKSVRLEFFFEHIGDEFFNQSFRAQLSMTLSTQIHLELTVTNFSKKE